jgi:hypothetical protein
MSEIQIIDLTKSSLNVYFIACFLIVQQKRADWKDWNYSIKTRSKSDNEIKRFEIKNQ